MNSEKNKYGITIVKRQASLKPKGSQVQASGQKHDVMDSAKRVIAEHRSVIKALAKR
jgi:hypothetical protein